jgi:hypothetical protein
VSNSSMPWCRGLRGGCRMRPTPVLCVHKGVDRSTDSHLSKGITCASQRGLALAAARHASARLQPTTAPSHQHNRGRGGHPDGTSHTQAGAAAPWAWAHAGQPAKQQVPRRSTAQASSCSNIVCIRTGWQWPPHSTCVYTLLMLSGSTGAPGGATPGAGSRTPRKPAGLPWHSAPKTSTAVLQHPCAQGFQSPAAPAHHHTCPPSPTVTRPQPRPMQMLPP